MGWAGWAEKSPQKKFRPPGDNKPPRAGRAYRVWVGHGLHSKKRVGSGRVWVGNSMSTGLRAGHGLHIFGNSRLCSAL
jgi:hypothetical protein